MIRLYLSGEMTLDVSGSRLAGRDFPGRQGRDALAYLTLNRTRMVPRAELAEAIWPGALPASWDGSLHSIVSKLRRLLGGLGLDGAAVLSHESGCYVFRLPAPAWVDHEAATDAIHQAESALAADDPRAAYGPSAVAHHIARRPFLPGSEAMWIDHQRERLESVLIRALECRAHIYLWNGEPTLAVEVSRDVVRRRPFRETGYQLLMRSHTAVGNTAEALRVYERCRTLIAEELGARPSKQTQAVHRSVLAAT